MTHIDNQYQSLLNRVITTGEYSDNRTGILTLFTIGAYLTADCTDKQIPIITTKQVAYKSAFSEMVGFITAKHNSNDFEKLGSRVWNQNANENQQWLDNPNRTGHGELGKIYGVQWRSWNNQIDQLQNVINDLQNNQDNRREIVLGWNPSELDQMALPPCHLLMQYSLTNQKTTLDLTVYQRSWDLFLGAPFNLAQYGFLLHLVAQITNKSPGTLHYMATNTHIYSNHTDQAEILLARAPQIEKPYIELNPDVHSLQDVQNLTESNNWHIDNLITVHNYDPHPAIPAPMAV